MRKLSPPGVETGPALERVEGSGEPVWVVRSFALARRILREPEATRQAGFGADQVFRARGMRPPILYLEGVSTDCSAAPPRASSRPR